jgi:hypothetical protein
VELRAETLTRRRKKYQDGTGKKLERALISFSFKRFSERVAAMIGEMA